MKTKEILVKAIEKVKKNGYNKKEPYYIYPDDIAGILIGNPEPPFVAEVCWVTEIIFSHDFAKAFWGEKYPDDFEFGDSPEHFRSEYWKTELTWMVLEPEPLKYLEKFL